MIRVQRVPVCKCGHEKTRHALVGLDYAGPCLHGCGCEGFHGGRARTVRVAAPPAAHSPAIDVALAAIEKARAALHEAETALRAAPGTLRLVSRPPPARKTPSLAGGAKGERRVAIAIAQHGARGVTREGLTVLTGYKRSSRDTYVQRLRAAGFVADAPSGGRLVATTAGVDWLGKDFRPLPTGEALIVHWRERLPPGELIVFDVVLSAAPASVSRETLSVSTGYKRSSRDTYIQRLRARELVTSGDDGAVRLADALTYGPAYEAGGR